MRYDPGVMTTESRLFWLMTVHTAVVAVSVAAIAYGLLQGVFGPARGDDVLLAAALAWPAAIGVGRWLNGAECVLQTWARELRGVETGWARDVWWIPEAWALRIPQTFTGPYVLAVGLCFGRWLERGG